MRFIQLTENLRINLEQVVAIEFHPAWKYRPEIDDCVFQDTLPRTASLMLMTTALTLETESRWDGEPLGVASRSIKYEVTGRDAEDAWKHLHNIHRWDS